MAHGASQYLSGGPGVGVQPDLCLHLAGNGSGDRRRAVAAQLGARPLGATSRLGPMRARRAITVVGCRASGEVGNVIVGAVLPPAGATFFEQMQNLRADASLRRLLLREPRGSVAVHANLI